MGKKPKKPKRKPSAYNRHIGREMKAGRTMKQAAASWKKGSKKSSPKKRASKSTKRRSNTTTRRGGFNTQKLFKLVRLGALALPAAGAIMSTRAPDQKIRKIGVDYFGVDIADGSFKLERMQAGWLPYLASIAATYGIPKIAGLIRSL